MDHREILIENMEQMARLRHDVSLAADAMRSFVMRNGPVRLDGQLNEQLQSQLGGLTRICTDIDALTGQAIEVLDQVNRMRGRIEAEGTDLPEVIDKLGEAVTFLPPPTQPKVVLESDAIRKLKSERDALALELNKLKTATSTS